MEFDFFLFGVEGYSRVTEVQLVRKRLASYLIKSGRLTPTPSPWPDLSANGQTLVVNAERCPGRAVPPVIQPPVNP